MSKGGWSREFDDEIVTPHGRKLVTLRDAAEYIVALPPLVQKMPQWQTTVAALAQLSWKQRTGQAFDGDLRRARRPALRRLQWPHANCAIITKRRAARSVCQRAPAQHVRHTRSFDMDVLLMDIAQKLEAKLLSPKAIETAIAAWNEERKHDRRQDSERASLEKRLRVLTTEIERLSHAIVNSKRKPDELLRMIDERDAERESVEEKLRLLGTASDNIVPFKNANPKIRDEYEADVKRLVSTLRTNPKNVETRLAFRSLINTIVLHPTRKRVPYEYTPYINKAVLLGMKLFPINRRSTKEIVGSQRFTKYDIVMHEKSVSS
jgi:site-specific DNA recombinase